MEQFWYDYLPALRKAFLLLILMVISCTPENSNDTKPDNINQGVGTTNRPAGKMALTDTIKIVDRPWIEILCTREKLQIRKVIGPFKTNVPADSVCWYVFGMSSGIGVEPLKGIGDNCPVTVRLDHEKLTGEIIFRVRPYKTGFISGTSEIRLLIENCLMPDHNRSGHARSARTSSYACNRDSTNINIQRRKIISEFRDLLYMYARTTSAREKEYFKAGAESKLNEIPNLSVDISSGNEIQSVFDDPAWSNPVVTPLYDLHRFFIVGVKVTQQ